jgi:hypothetical protein
MVRLMAVVVEARKEKLAVLLQQAQVVVVVYQRLALMVQAQTVGLVAQAC